MRLRIRPLGIEEIERQMARLRLTLAKEAADRLVNGAKPAKGCYILCAVSWILCVCPTCVERLDAHTSPLSLCFCDTHALRTRSYLIGIRDPESRVRVCDSFGVTYRIVLLLQLSSVIGLC